MIGTVLVLLFYGLVWTFCWALQERAMQLRARRWAQSANAAIDEARKTMETATRRVQEHSTISEALASGVPFTVEVTFQGETVRRVWVPASQIPAGRADLQIGGADEWPEELV